MRAILSPDVPSGGALRTGGRTAAIPEFGDIFLRRTEAFAMIFSDDELNRPRTPKPASMGVRTGARPGFRNQGVLLEREGIFLFESAVTH
jgi:hypothetical protein